MKVYFSMMNMLLLWRKGITMKMLLMSSLLRKGKMSNMLVRTVLVRIGKILEVKVLCWTWENYLLLLMIPGMHLVHESCALFWFMTICVSCHSVLTPEAGEDREVVLQHDEHDVAREEGKHNEDAVDVQPLEEGKGVKHASPDHAREDRKDLGGEGTVLDLGELSSALDDSRYASCTRVLCIVLVYDNMCFLSQCVDSRGGGRS